MSSDPKSDFSRLLLRLHQEEATGVIHLKEGERELTLYVKGGVIVYAGGIDRELLLLTGIASRKKLDQEDLDSLRRLLVEEPLFFGKTLLERNLISKSDWVRFLDAKVRDVVAAAQEMKNPEILFNQSELGILPVNFIHCPVPALLLGETQENGEAFPPAFPSDKERSEYEDMISLYLSLIRTMKDGFRDKEFEDMSGKCLESAAGPIKTLFHDLAWVAEDPETVVREVMRRFSGLGKLANRRLVLLTAFNKFIYLMLLRLRKRAGKNRAGLTLEAMMKTLLKAEESKRHPDLMVYLLGNLEDYARQMGSR